MATAKVSSKLEPERKNVADAMVDPASIPKVARD
jgi:hypothetical protein